LTKEEVLAVVILFSIRHPSVSWDLVRQGHA